MWTVVSKFSKEARPFFSLNVKLVGNWWKSFEQLVQANSIWANPNISVGQMQPSTVWPLAQKPCLLLNRSEAEWSWEMQEPGRIYQALHLASGAMRVHARPHWNMETMGWCLAQCLAGNRISVNVIDVTCSRMVILPRSLRWVTALGATSTPFSVTVSGFMLVSLWF